MSPSALHTMFALADEGDTASRGAVLSSSPSLPLPRVSRCAVLALCAASTSYSTSGGHHMRNSLEGEHTHTVLCGSMCDALIWIMMMVPELHTSEPHYNMGCWHFELHHIDVSGLAKFECCHAGGELSNGTAELFVWHSSAYCDTNGRMDANLINACMGAGCMSTDLGLAKSTTSTVPTHGNESMPILRNKSTMSQYITMSSGILLCKRRIPEDIMIY